MSIHSAHRFIRQLRSDSALRERLIEPAMQQGLAALAAESVRAGTGCTPAELREAFEQDYGLRWLLCGSSPPTSEHQG